MSAAAGSPPLRRDTRRGLVGGVLAGLAAKTGIDLALLRVAFVIVTIVSGGLALLAYVVAWAAIPAVGGDSAPLTRIGRLTRLGPLPRGRADRRVAAGVGLLTLSALLAFRELDIWWSDALVWPLVLASFGVALLWQRSRGGPIPEEAPQASAGGKPMVADAAELGRGTGRAIPRPPSRLADLYSGVFGVLLVLGAALLFLSLNDILGGLRDAALTTVVAAVAIGLILAPFLWRLGRNLAAERAERIRSQERAELAAHLHDSVLQTLTLMQKRADDPREIAALARRQERELRDWLAGDDRRSKPATFAAALRSEAEAVEDDQRVAVDVVVVGNCELDERAEAVLGAAREALINAAKHAPEPGPIRVFAEVDDARIEAFVRDRGPGFELGTVAPDRRGVRESIIGRMERAGGRADVRSIAGVGTEVGLVIERDESAREAERR
jgi:phage shock protein PspC (stress-responsive transcriptional regulator)/two-component sensor histidine kinase